MDTIQTTVFAQSLSNFICKMWMMRGGPYWFLVTGSKVKVNFGTLCIRPCGHDTYYSFCPITFNLHMTVVDHERRNPIDFVTGSKVKVNFGTLCIRPCGHDTVQFLPNHFQTSHVSYGKWGEEPFWFWVTGSKVKVKFGTLCIRPCGHDTDYSFCPITYKLHIKVVDDERRGPIDLG